MPRRHPKEDDKPTGPSPIVLAERRERRALRRIRKSPAQGLDNGLLTTEERSIISTELRSLRRGDALVSDASTREQQIGSLQRELDLDQACRQKKPLRIS